MQKIKSGFLVFGIPITYLLVLIGTFKVISDIFQKIAIEDAALDFGVKGLIILISVIVLGMVGWTSWIAVSDNFKELQS